MTCYLLALWLYCQRFYQIPVFVIFISAKFLVRKRVSLHFVSYLTQDFMDGLVSKFQPF